jgi:hypothetical protein
LKTVNKVTPKTREINEAHRLARQSAETAVGHAIRCGQMLAEAKVAAGHGKWLNWLEKNCPDISERQAQRYMDAATKSDTRVGFESLRQLLGVEPKPRVDKKKTESKREAPAPQAQESNRTGVTIESAGESRVASASSGASLVDSSPKPTFTDEQLKTIAKEHEAHVGDSDSDEPERPSDDEMADMDAAVEREYQAAIAKAVDIGAQEKIRQLSLEIVLLQKSRDTFMNKANAAAELVTKRDQTIEKLGRKIKRLEDELASAKERIAIMEDAA